ncbi:MAG: hypothetical protein ACRDNL_16775, partial [Spirillospora sp.]
MGDRATATLRHPPRLGEHTAEVARELGYDDAAIDALIRRGALVDGALVDTGARAEEGHAPLQ